MAETHKPVEYPPGSPLADRIIHGVDTHTADGAAFPFATIHANLASTTARQRVRKRHVVVQTGYIPHATLEEIQSTFLDIRQMWKWQFDTQRIETLSAGDDDESIFYNRNLPVPLYYQQRVYFYHKSGNAKDRHGPSNEPIVQKVVAVTPNAVTLLIDRRPPVRNILVTLSAEPNTSTEDEEIKKGIKVTIEFSYQLGWFLETLVSLGLVNANQHVRHYLQKDIASLQHYMETKEITTPETNLNVSHDNDEEK